jgi:anti-anti-sigma factor
MTITPIHSGDVVVLRVAGRLDAITTQEFENTCQQYITSESRRLILDFESLDYISSAGLRAILLVGKALRVSGRTLGLRGFHGTVKETLEMAGFCTLFPIYDSSEAFLEPR